MQKRCGSLDGDKRGGSQAVVFALQAAQLQGSEAARLRALMIGGRPSPISFEHLQGMAAGRQRVCGSSCTCS